jgi:hypothetical protein
VLEPLAKLSYDVDGGRGGRLHGWLPHSNSTNKIAIIIDGLNKCEETERKLMLLFLLPLLDESNSHDSGSMRMMFHKSRRGLYALRAAQSRGYSDYSSRHYNGHPDIHGVLEVANPGLV